MRRPRRHRKSRGRQNPASEFFDELKHKAADSLTDFVLRNIGIPLNHIDPAREPRGLKRLNIYDQL